MFIKPGVWFIITFTKEVLQSVAFVGLLRLFICDFSDSTRPIFAKFGIYVQNHKSKKLLTVESSRSEQPH